MSFRLEIVTNCVYCVRTLDIYGILIYIYIYIIIYLRYFFQKNNKNNKAKITTKEDLFSSYLPRKVHYYLHTHVTFVYTTCTYMYMCTHTLHVLLFLLFKFFFLWLLLL